MPQMPPIQAIADDVCLAGQLDPEAMTWAAQKGFRSIINNRPDFEGGPDQPTSQAIEAAALALGLTYVHQPVGPAYQSPEEVAHFSQLLNSLPRPILAFCRSGARCGKLYRAATGG